MDIKNKLISLIIPVYNSEKFLSRCLESVISQTYEYLQIIIIDDGSKDNSYEICKKYEGFDNRIELYHQENSGVSATRNFGLQKATGDYIGFVDSDDWIDPTMYEKLMTYAKKYDSDITICGYINESPDGKIIWTSNHLEKNQFTKEEAIEIVLDNDYFRGYVHNKLFRKALFSQGNQLFFDKKIHIQEDLLFVCNAISISSKIAYCPENLYHYIAHEASATLRKFDEKHLSALLAHKKISDLCLGIKPDLLATVKTREIIINLNILGKICKSKENYRKWSTLIIQNLEELKPFWKVDKELAMKYRIALTVISISPIIFFRLYFLLSKF